MMKLLHVLIVLGVTLPLYMQRNVRSMNQGKLDVVKQKMVRVNIDILVLGELKWMATGKFNSDGNYIYYCGQESLGRNGVAIIVKQKSPKCSESESEVAQSCPTLCNPVDYSPPSSSVYGILQARILEWFAISFSKYLFLPPFLDHSGMCDLPRLGIEPMLCAMGTQSLNHWAMRKSTLVAISKTRE